MKPQLTVFLALFLLSACRTENTKTVVNKPKFPSYSQDFAAPSKQQDFFKLSQDYPDTFNAAEKHPWADIDFKSDYKRYMQAVLQYCLEGNTEVDFKVQDNKIRKWYHTPWLNYGLNGREFYHGLTRERPVPIQELHNKQDVSLENWAIGFYNPPGGYTIGRVWNTDTIPNPKLADFPEGTVSFKLLFTAGTTDKVPFLKGTKEWKANIFACNPEIGTPEERAVCKTKRVDSTVRLLQIDIAVKDKRAGETGWVFGTFIYDASQKSNDIWQKMVPVGLMWGDDKNVDTLINKEGAFKNPRLQQTRLNSRLIAHSDVDHGIKAYMSHHGLGGRLNGPIDNPTSSCISCHSKSAVTDFGRPAPMADFGLTRAKFTVREFQKYFSTINGGTGALVIGITTYNKLDYSLQLAAGIRNFYQSIIDKKKSDATGKKGRGTARAPAQPIEDLPEVTRGNLNDN